MATVLNSTNVNQSFRPWPPFGSVHPVAWKAHHGWLAVIIIQGNHYEPPDRSFPPLDIKVSKPAGVRLWGWEANLKNNDEHNSHIHGLVPRLCKLITINWLLVDLIYHILEDSVPNSSDVVCQDTVTNSLRVNAILPLGQLSWRVVWPVSPMTIGPLLHFFDCKMSSSGRNSVAWATVMAFKSTDGGPDGSMKERKYIFNSNVNIYSYKDKSLPLHDGRSPV